MPLLPVQSYCLNRRCWFDEAKSSSATKWTKHSFFRQCFWKMSFLPCLHFKDWSKRWIFCCATRKSWVLIFKKTRIEDTSIPCSWGLLKFLVPAIGQKKTSTVRTRHYHLLNYRRSKTSPTFVFLTFVSFHPVLLCLFWTQKQTFSVAEQQKCRIIST